MTEPSKLPYSSVPDHQPAAGGIAARARAAASPRYLDGLNPEQREAVETLDGPVLVLAGAGTGKTRVLTTRVAHILATGRARPSEILAVTFTNKAAREMKQRVGAMVGQIVEGMPWLGTFHSIGVKILRRHAELVGLKPDFTILDQDDQIRLLKQLLEADNIDEKRWPARVLAGLIDSCGIGGACGSWRGALPGSAIPRSVLDPDGWVGAPHGRSESHAKDGIRRVEWGGAVQRFPGIAIRRPAASGRGRLACDAFMRASPRATSSGKGAVLPAVMSTWSDMFSEVAATQPSSAWKSCSKKCRRLAS